MEYTPFEPGIEVNAQTVYTIVDGFSVVRHVPSRILAESGIGELRGDGSLILGREGWYSQALWLRAFRRIASEVGTGALHSIGLRIPANAIFPPSVNDIDSAIQSIDIAYHMNHRKAGVVMFDPETGAMLEGIGHYGCQRTPGRNEIVSVCENPYPCAFDHGILTAMAKRFQARSIVEHDDRAPCRRKGKDSCTYVIRW